MSAALETAGTQKRLGPAYNIYTALLGLALLVLAATATVVCLYAQNMYGEIFTVTPMP